MSTDPNWLYSTIAQSSAALVAIVGGFVLSRLLTVAQERDATEMRLAEVRAELQPKQSEYKPLYERRLQRRILYDLLTKDVLQALVKAQGNLPLGKAAEMASFRSYPLQEIEPFWNEIIATTKAILVITPETPEDPPVGSSEVRAFLEQHGIEYTIFADKIFYQAYADYQSRNKRSRQEKTTGPLAAFQRGPEMQLNLTGIINREVDAEVRVVDGILDKDIATLRSEILPLEQKEKDLKSRLASLEHPKGIVPAIVVLLVFALVGIVLPVLMLPVSSDSFSASDRWIAIGLFLSGLLLFFGYLVRLARSL